MRKYELLLGFSIVSLFVSGKNPTDNKEKPVKNVVVILADDHALKVSGSYGNQIIRIPSIDKLAKEGIAFTQAYCNSPSCSASRQSILTGKYPHAIIHQIEGFFYSNCNL